MQEYRQFILQQLAAAANANVPLHSALRGASAEAPSGKLREELAKIAEMLESGAPPDVALARFPWLFSRGDVDAIAIARENGQLPEVLMLMLRHEQQQRLRGQSLHGVMVLPLVELALTGLMLSFLGVFILPKFFAIFRDLTEGRTELPRIASFLVSLMNGNIGGLWLLGSAIVVLWLFWHLFRFYMDMVMPYVSAKFDYYLNDLIEDLFPLVHGLGRDSFAVFGIPIVRQWGREAMTMQFCGYMELFLAAKMRADDAVDAASGAMSRYFFRNRMVLAQVMVTAGNKLSDALAATNFFPRTALWIIRNGEARGEVAEAFGRVADFYSVKLRGRSQHIRNWAFPVGAICAGAVVGSLAYGLFSTVVSIVERLQ